MPETLRRLRQVTEVDEIIVADGGSRDATVTIATRAGCRVVDSAPGRGLQQRNGAALASSPVILFLHADTWVEASAGRAIERALHDAGIVGGAFWKIFRDPHWLMRGSRWRCWTRLHLFGRLAADQAIFVRRDVLERVGGMPDQPLMEEFELCRRLRRAGRLVLADGVVSTSARRWHERGVLRTYVRMWRVTAMHYLGVSPARLARIYESR